MTDDATNIVSFAARPKKAVLALQSVEVRLLGECCDLEMTLADTDGNIVAVLAYSLASRQPADFDLGRLITAWAGWRSTSTIAS